MSQGQLLGLSPWKDIQRDDKQLQGLFRQAYTVNVLIVFTRESSMFCQETQPINAVTHHMTNRRQFPDRKREIFSFTHH